MILLTFDLDGRCPPTLRISLNSAPTGGGGVCVGGGVGVAVSLLYPAATLNLDRRGHCNLHRHVEERKSERPLEIYRSDAHRHSACRPKGGVWIFQVGLLGVRARGEGSPLSALCMFQRAPSLKARPPGYHARRFLEAVNA